jgi:hypothetical protein
VNEEVPGRNCHFFLNLYENENFLGKEGENNENHPEKEGEQKSGVENPPQFFIVFGGIQFRDPYPHGLL